METCKDLAGERCHAPGQEQDRGKPKDLLLALLKNKKIFILTNTDCQLMSRRAIR